MLKGQSPVSNKSLAESVDSTVCLQKQYDFVISTDGSVTVIIFLWLNSNHNIYCTYVKKQKNFH